MIHSNKKGFTLIEMLVAISIIIIISAFMVPNFRENETGTTLIRVAQQVVQDIREAQNMSLSSKEYNGNVYEYYGVYFDKQSLPSSYYIFASENSVYNSGEEIKTKQLEKNITIDSIKVGSEKSSVDIAFNPPYSYMNINPPSSNKVIITLKTENGVCPEDCIYVEIDDNGWISVKRTPSEGDEEDVLCSGGAGSDDVDCGTIGCSGWYVQSGVESATGTEECYNKQDITSARCEGIEDCKDSNSSDCIGESNNQLQYSCGTCQYIKSTNCSGIDRGSCSNYLEGTFCGSGMECDGSGSCVLAVTCSGGAGTDDSDCGIIDCSGWYEQTGTQGADTTEHCYNKQDITSARCEGVGNCKDPNSPDCNEQSSDAEQYSCGICQYISDSNCNGTTLGNCSNYPIGTSCGTEDECNGEGVCGHTFVNPQISDTPLKCDRHSVNKFCESLGYGCTHWEWTCGENPQIPSCAWADPSCGDIHLSSICFTAVTQLTCH